MASEPKLTRAEIKRIITEEVRKAAKTQLADSTSRQHPINDQYGTGITLMIEDFRLDGVLIPATEADSKMLNALKKLGKPKPLKKKAASPKKS